MYKNELKVCLYKKIHSSHQKAGMVEVYAIDLWISKMGYVNTMEYHVAMKRTVVLITCQHE
jgi:hypothetical protein